jgi:hypothetical protein
MEPQESQDLFNREPRGIRGQRQRQKKTEILLPSFFPRIPRLKILPALFFILHSLSAVALRRRKHCAFSHLPAVSKAEPTPNDSKMKNVRLCGSDGFTIIE